MIARVMEKFPDGTHHVASQTVEIRFLSQKFISTKQVLRSSFFFNML